MYAAMDSGQLGKADEIKTQGGVDLITVRTTLGAMLPRSRTTAFGFSSGTFVLCLVFFCLASAAHAASLPVFAVVFGQVTNEIATIQANFDDSTAQKEKLGRLVRARSVILNPALRDDQALAELVKLLGNNGDYDATLNESARNARASVMGTYDLMGVRVAGLPPSPRATQARNRFESLAPDAAVLANAQTAEAISGLLAPFGRQLESIRKLVERAAVMPVPNVRPNAVRAQADDRRFASAGDGAHSPNLFEVTAPDPFYWTLFCRAVDTERVITFTLPVITDEVRYEVAQGLVTLTYTKDVFAPDALAVPATNGTFFVQRDRNEVYGVFTARGPGFEVTNGRFRIKLPAELRGRE